MRIVLWAALGLPAGLGIYLAGLQLTGNIHTVEPGALYRSAQLGEGALADVIDDYHIKSVINLRGAVPQASWYRSEIAVSKARGVVHYDLPLSANSLVDPATMARISALLRSAPKPVLIHCQSGADRSGLVAALYEYAIAARPLEERARAALTALWTFPLSLEPHRGDGQEFRDLRAPVFSKSAGPDRYKR